jgi:anti-sigma factor RsiW
MRCRDAKKWLSAQRDGDLTPLHAEALEEHLAHCGTCHSEAQEQRNFDTIIGSINDRVSNTDTPLVRPASISTDQIMRAIQKQKHITSQLEDLRRQQQMRVSRMRTVGTVSAALGFLILSSIPLMFLVIVFLQTDLALDALSLLNGVIDGGIVLGQYVQTGLTLVTRDNLLLSGLAFAVVVMMGMWLRLMRSPQEV